MNFNKFFIISTWWGKLIGAFLGFLADGSVGALFGFLIGNLFDRKLVHYYTNPNLVYYSEKNKHVKEIFLKATFLVMGHIAKANGRVSEQAINNARYVMKEMHLNYQQKNLAKKYFYEGKQASYKLEPILTQVAQLCRYKVGLLKLFVDIQYQAAHADGLSSQKIKLLDLVFTYLGFAPLSQQFYFHEYSKDSSYQYHKNTSTQQNSNLEKAYALFEVNAKATKQEIKRAYRRLLSCNHPDKLIAKGLSEDMIKQANNKTHQIMKAYELICQSKGWI